MEKSPTDLFIVETPLQMINAIEARAYFKSQNNLLIILLRPQIPHSIFQTLIDMEPWPNIKWLSLQTQESGFYLMPFKSNIHYKISEYYSYFQQYLFRCRIQRVLHACGIINRVFIGNYLKSYMRHIANRSKSRECIVLDDGTDSIRVHNYRQELNTDSSLNVIRKDFESLSLTSIKKKMHNFLHELDTRQIYNPVFFSAYDLDILPGDKKIKNEYRYLKKKTKKTQSAEDIYFLGQCLVDDQWMSKQEYFNLLEKVGNFYKKRNIIYVSHPRETKKILGEIETNFGFEIMSFDLPIEIEILKNGTPGELSSFFCSALEDCRLIFENHLNITAFIIKPEQCMCHKNFVKKIYKYWKTNECDHFKLVSL